MKVRLLSGQYAPDSGLYSSGDRGGSKELAAGVLKYVEESDSQHPVRTRRQRRYTLEDRPLSADSHMLEHPLRDRGEVIVVAHRMVARGRAERPALLFEFLKFLAIEAVLPDPTPIVFIGNHIKAG